MTIETVRINNRGREHLSKLKRLTKIETYNILCRWAFCISLAEKTPPPPIDSRVDKGLEMTWRTFAGKNEEIYDGLLRSRCLQDGYSLDDKALLEQLRLHIHRGLGYLAGNRNLKGIEDLFVIGLKKS